MADNRGAQVQQVVDYLNAHQWTGDHSQITAALWDLNDADFQRLSQQIQSGRVPVGKVTDVVEKQFTTQQAAYKPSPAPASGVQSSTSSPQPGSGTPIYQTGPPQPTSVAEAAGSVTGDRWGELSAALGYDARAAYQRYAGNLKYGQDISRQSGSMAQRYGNENLTPPDPVQWVSDQEQHIYGQYKPIVDNLASYTAKQTGQALDYETRQKLLKAMQTATPEARDMLTKWLGDESVYEAQQQATANGENPASPFVAGATKPQALLSAFPWLGDILDTSKANTDAARRKEVESSFQSRTGRPMTDAEWNQLKNMGLTQMQTFTDNLSMGNGLTYGQYDYNRDRVNKAYYQYGLGTPTDKDIVHAATLSDEALDHFVYNRPSHVQGMNVGQYQELATNADKVSNDLWGVPASHDMLATLQASLK